MDLELLLLVAIVAALLIAIVWSLDRWVPISLRETLPAAPLSKIEPPVVLLLSNVRGAELSPTGPHTYTVLVRRTPGWVWIPLLFTFPLGLLFLLFKQSGSMVVTLVPLGAGTEVQVTGKTKKSVEKLLRNALAATHTPQAING